jgi:hypothetical protein
LKNSSNLAKKTEPRRSTSLREQAAALSRSDYSYAATVGDYSRGATVGDFNGDGIDDVFVANRNQANEVLLGDGQGGFTSTLLPWASTLGRLWVE